MFSAPHYSTAASALPVPAILYCLRLKAAWVSYAYQHANIRLGHTRSDLRPQGHLRSASCGIHTQFTSKRKSTRILACICTMEHVEDIAQKPYLQLGRCNSFLATWLLRLRLALSLSSPCCGSMLTEGLRIQVKITMLNRSRSPTF
jgi:hypothetical protein